MSQQQGQSPYPFVPLHSFGALFEKDGERFVFWTIDATVEAAEAGSASERSVIAMQDAVERLLSRGERHPARIADALEGLGFTRIGYRRYNFQSGILVQSAWRLAELALRAEDQRQEIIARNAGKFPEPLSRDWRKWTEVSATRNACPYGSRVLAVAAVEALVNEILKERFPDVFDRLERKRTTPLIPKIEKLWLLSDEGSPPAWLERFRQEVRKRRAIVHHKPEYVDTPADGEGQEAESFFDARGAEALLHLVEVIVADLMAVFGAPNIPSTHRRNADILPP